MVGKLLLAFWILRWIALRVGPAAAMKWPTPLEEALDERRDAEIFRAVVQSMREWELLRKHNQRTKRDVSRVCYEDVGCFEDTGPFSYLEMLPSPPKDVGTRFLVYGSRKARSIPMEVPAEDINDRAHHAIDPEIPTKVIVHGFGSSCDHIWVYEMRSALMSVHECNIVCVDWGPGSAVPNYLRAAANTRLVGRQLAKLVRSLNVPLEKVHLIGFSLGAHVAGFAGAELGNVSRITGLDPAGPLFEAQDPRARLDATDAHFVDVIHSNGEQLLLGGLGSWQPMGDVDFYPNGGRMQTGCSNLFLGAVSDIIWSSAVEGRSLCNHRRAYKLFTDSVSPRCRFPAFPCDHGYDGLVRGDCFPCGVNGAEKPCGDMGYYSDTSPARGQLYLVTREEEPFCAHQYQIKLYNSRGERPARSYGKLQVTLVGEDSFNDTFTMTRKDDEELMVGAILQKIVVPHPAVADLEAIEVKYTAYSGWISSGLVSWSIDKVAVVDSFGKSLSVCKRGLNLESGRPVFLPLYPGECNVPSEPETTVSPTTTPVAEQFVQEKQGGIGPFTKEQNFEKESFSAEVIEKDEGGGNAGKGLGPFTRAQNLKILDEKDTFRPRSVFGDAKLFATVTSSAGNSNPWSVADLNDGGSNSLETTSIDSDGGRGFSDSSTAWQTTESPNISKSIESTTTTATTTTTTTTTERLDEIREPVLKLSKETGRSLKLSEITEPILRPRPARQNSKSESFRQDKRLEEPRPSPRGFTVQFLPERLAGILAQAERYARQTLLPLISQYTPSFVGGARDDRPKYFPPLGDIVEESLEDTYSREIVNSDKSRKKTTKDDENASIETLLVDEETFVEDYTKKNRAGDSNASHESVNVEDRNSRIDAREEFARQETPSSVETTNDSASVEVAGDQSDWVPIEGYRDASITGVKSRSNSSRSLEARTGSKMVESTPYEGRWLTKDTASRSSRPEASDAQRDTKTGDRLSLIDGKPNGATAQEPSAAASSVKPPTTTSTTAGTIESIQRVSEKPTTEKAEQASRRDAADLSRTSGRKYIPLVDFERPDEFFVSEMAGNLSTTPSFSSTESDPVSHIQRIPRPTGPKETPLRKRPTTRSMAFPYAYERKNDPRTRYIPLLPEEDMKRPKSSLMERDR